MYDCFDSLPVFFVLKVTRWFLDGFYAQLFVPLLWLPAKWGGLWSAATCRSRVVARADPVWVDKLAWIENNLIQCHNVAEPDRRHLVCWMLCNPMYGFMSSRVFDWPWILNNELSQIKKKKMCQSEKTSKSLRKSWESLKVKNSIKIGQNRELKKSAVLVSLLQLRVRMIFSYTEMLKRWCSCSWRRSADSFAALRLCLCVNSDFEDNVSE